MFAVRTPVQKKLLRRAARLWGLQPDYLDYTGKVVGVHHQALLQVLAHKSGRPLADEAALRELIEIKKVQKYEAGLDPVTLITDRELELTLYIPADDLMTSFEIRMTTEAGENLSGHLTSSPDRRTLRAFGKTFRKIHLQSELEIPMGYHHLEVYANGKFFAKTFVICSRPLATMKPPAKRWGLFTPLYALSSHKSWGLGDFNDLCEVQNQVFAWGGDFVGTLPILAVESQDPNPSPYSPTSRLFWNEVYLHIPDLLAEQGEQAVNEVLAEIRRLQDSPEINAAAVMALKKPILKNLAQGFFNKPLPVAYEFFLANTPYVEDYAKYRAKGDPSEVEYHLYVQFKMHEALEKINKRAQDGESAGLYLDLTVGVNAQSFDVEKFPSSFLLGMTAGAPPDLMFHGGQNWGFPPMDPQGLRADEYRYFILSLRQNMRYTRYLRLDHVMGFQRIYAIPQGNGACDGVYIRYQTRELFAILQIEAQRAGVTVIGENLGTVPASIQRALEENNCLGMWVYPFEVGENPEASVAKIKPKNLACLNTHDMSPFAGYIEGVDIELYRELHILGAKAAEKMKKERKHLVKTWKKKWDVSKPAELFQKTIELIASSPAELLLINVEDLWQETEPQNVPGTWKEYPNWRRKLARANEQWLQDHAIKSVLKNVTALRQQGKVDYE